MMKSQSSNINLGVLACNPLMALGLAYYIEDLQLGHRCQMATMSLTGLGDRLRQAAVFGVISRSERIATGNGHHSPAASNAA
ncbi:Uncharacterised protein [Serratia fonticola]|uniref:Uncharacterized protein n=1 Tax=Serratia fonticola TaxID=47917 RepID=A0A4U9V733_SERFO|nr:Uncharacterised protein [Serratia fonticola]